MTPIKPMIVTEKHYWPHIAAIACLWASAMTMDYYDQKNTAQEATAQMVACLNGTYRATTESGDKVACMKAEVLAKNEVRK